MTSSAGSRTSFDLLIGSDARETMRLDRATAAEYAALTGHGSDQLEAGFAPPLMCVRALPLVGTALLARLGEELGSGFAIQHVAQEVRFERPIPLGEVVEIAGRVAEVGDCGTRQGMRIQTELAVHGRPAVTMNTTVTGGPALGQGRLPIDVLGLRPGEELARASTPIVPELPGRYAQVSGDDNPLHLDDDFARAVGFPGVIVQGMATIALAVAAATRDCPAIESGAISRLIARMARPVLPGDTIVTSVFATEAPGAFRLRVGGERGEVLKSFALWVR